MAERGRLEPAVAEVRVAVRATVKDLGPARHILVACSGGPDSMALAAGAAFVGPQAGLSVGAVVVDHRLQPGSGRVAAAVVERLRSEPVFDGIGTVTLAEVSVGTRGGPEGAAREARYRAIDEVAAAEDAIVLLGHTLEDQAETVLLGLARGSGIRSLAGMRPVHGRYRRPLLAVSRDVTQRACRALGIETWSDPHNEDPRYLRVRVRRSVLPVLEAELGPGISAALARTAELAALDGDALDAMAAEILARRDRATGRDARDGDEIAEIRLDGLSEALPAVRRRVLRLAALRAGCPAGELSAVHIVGMDALVADWHGQRGVDLPGDVTAVRRGWRLAFVGTGATRTRRSGLRPAD